MNLKLDKKGYLFPYERINVKFKEFEDFFVQSFNPDSSRFEILENYKKFIHDFSNQVTPNFTHWIDGSFVTNKVNPRDIDFITLIQHDIYENKRELIDSSFRLKGGKDNYNVDAYTIEILPKDHKNYSIFKIDLVYWYTGIIGLVKPRRIGKRKIFRKDISKSILDKMVKNK